VALQAYRATLDHRGIAYFRPSPSERSVALSFFFLLLLLLGATPCQAQALREVSRVQLERAMPEADLFSEREGDPPVFRAYRLDVSTGQETLLGYVFRTSDVPPEVIGYTAPVDALVGMDLQGMLTGVQVLRYRESLRSTRGDFFAVPGFEEQFIGKFIADAFRPRGDVDNISGATISVDAMARGVRSAARRVAAAYLSDSEAGEGASISLEELEERFWIDMVPDGPVYRLDVVQGGVALLVLYIAYIWRDEVGEVLLGPELFGRALEGLGDRARADHLLLLAVEGTTALFQPNLLAIVQGTDTLLVDAEDLVLFPAPREGKVAGQVRSAGIWAVEERIDMSRPFTVAFGGGPGMDVYTVEHPGREGQEVVVADAGGGDGSEQPRPPSDPAGETVSGAAPDPDRADDDAEVVAQAGGDPGLEELRFLEIEEEESQLTRTLARTSWGRVGGLGLLLVLATVAFISKSTLLRWTALAFTVGYLGFVDGGFLSVSHITSAIEAGPGVFFNDISLLLMVGFTVITTLFWGRVFCGYLCPFGALQDLIEIVVPQRFQREMPWWLHDRASLLKYLILILVLIPPAIASLAPSLVEDPISLYQFAEPFGTVFFLSSSVLLWVIAVGFLAASAVVPRFYCRYVCPLGAALAVVSGVAPFRIRRVEQCTLCNVCEQSCPTRAIRGAEIDFPECVRCNICEVKLIERAGACRHEMEEIRPRLTQIQMSAR
jgi:NosR/NirI family nitrous oxide reductase transcriptional regulator